MLISVNNLTILSFKCATSKQMARCKTRFYLNDIHSSEIFENIFPGKLKNLPFSKLLRFQYHNFKANEISETYYAARFDGQAGRRLFDHVIDILLKIEFIDLSYMLEEHIPLSNPENYPIYVLNEFPGESFSLQCDINRYFQIWMGIFGISKHFCQTTPVSKLIFQKLRHNLSLK